MYSLKTKYNSIACVLKNLKNAGNELNIQLLFAEFWYIRDLAEITYVLFSLFFAYKTGHFLANIHEQ